MEQILSTQVWNGKTVGDYLTVEFLAGLAGDILALIVIVVLGLWVSSWIRNRIVNIAAGNRHLDDTLFNFLGNIASYAVLAFAGIFILNTFGIQTTSIVAVIGAAGLAIGLALQGTLSNVAAGVMIILFRPFKNGDFVEVNGVSGTVKQISLNFTELSSVGNVQVIVPNSQVWGNTITNYSAYPTRRAEWIFGVGYGVDLGKAEQVIRDTIMSDPRSKTEPEPFIQVNGLNDFSVDFLVRVWVNSSDYFQYQADMKRKVKEALDANGIDIPFPTQTLIQSQ
ncbi:mechanosensitive ion channel [Marivivens sp. LCG002]|uniref:mechanosensitive ion channel family protein n=1 Tax=Marivivens sp. LCG002 TaxID=3051171 RepID=UPI0025569B57|nr:mechanosensitive ion channel domain-containing protein [Marivivens sp. LCG002]WIV50967.1 mechanosensitive ion channel [Marivivens sp. LCG002]